MTLLNMDLSLEEQPTIKRKPNHSSQIVAVMEATETIMVDRANSKVTMQIQLPTLATEQLHRVINRDHMATAEHERTHCGWTQRTSIDQSQFWKTSTGNEY